MPKKSEIRLVCEDLSANKPVQVGNTYCSPACGWGCKLANYKKAVRGATALQKKLKGNWKGRVFENLGWHFDASSGPLTVVGDYHGENGTARYTCYLEGHLVTRGSYSDPREAVEKVLQHCSSSAATGLTILEFAYKAAGQEEKFLGWLRHACPSLARRALGDGFPDLDGGWSEPKPDCSQDITCMSIADSELAALVGKMDGSLPGKK